MKGLVNMKISLINPQTEVNGMRELYGYHENLGIALIAAYLRANGHETSIYDLRVDKLNEKELVDILINNNTDLIGLSINYATFPSALKIAQILKFQSKHCTVVLGGEHATYLDKEILEQYSIIDCIIRGEGEDTFLKLVNTIENNEDIRKVKNISFIDKNGKKFTRTNDESSITILDTIAFAARDVAISAIKKNIPIEIGILAERGCPFSCSFCNGDRFFSNGKVGLIRRRSPLNVVNEMMSLTPLFKNKELILHFYDATFITRSADSRAWIDEFCSLLEERNLKIPFDAFIRSDSFDFDRDEELINRLVNNGLIGTYVGLEAGDDDTLQLYNKGIKSNQSLYTIDKLKKFKIEGYTNGVICFHQDVTLKEVMHTTTFLYKIGLCSFWNIVSRAETLPGIPLEKQMSVLPRKNIWDVENYYFKDERVTLLYNILVKIKSSYFIAQYEDYLSRKLRYSLKLKEFYLTDKLINSLSKVVEKDILEMQKSTYGFIVTTINGIENHTIVNCEQYTKEIIIYVSQITSKLHNIYIKYSHLLHSKRYVSSEVQGVI